MSDTTNTNTTRSEIINKNLSTSLDKVKDLNMPVITNDGNLRKSHTRHSDMDCVFQLFKTYCKIGFMTFGAVFMANIIKLITGRTIPFELLCKMGSRDFFSIFIGIIISSGAFGLAWPNIPFLLLAQKYQLTSPKK